MKRAKKEASDDPKGRSNRSLYVILAGLVVGGIVAWWRWLRSLPK